ncbi:hypothetical protein TWF569_000375 [Orbilia oligospora]|uniref:Uncharacterized protein n=1 Tax=Orbilia oligospora TaxID=2813651 RepID=A0A7C8JRE5_ORBOL|nr:hypothetical protein TWF706_001257 [Orbilia oligospora]KAF3096178.1 hypothetical protein TWF102_006798 [Orbilia oligospora]KAF3114524.1 hypothetical protein TWF103_000993 [Orbilia oligospora]KAF3126574.1 hypothetical protein TWF703_010445 [Orbilia oligospora]KAF3133765.1 hypothetical protein TWF594_008926 [Orbilia oligospora]
MILRPRNTDTGFNPSPTQPGYPSPAIPSPSETTGNEANRVAHVTSAVIGCILGAALAGAIFALGLALYRFRRRQKLRRRLLERITVQIESEHVSDDTPLDDETRQRLVAERFHVVAERYWRQQRRLYARNGRRPTRRRDDLRDMAGDLYRNQTSGVNTNSGTNSETRELREPESVYLRFGGTNYMPIYSFLGSGRDREREGG